MTKSQSGALGHHPRHVQRPKVLFVDYFADVADGFTGGLREDQPVEETADKGAGEVAGGGGGRASVRRQRGQEEADVLEEGGVRQVGQGEAGAEPHRAGGGFPIGLKQAERKGVEGLGAAWFGGELDHGSRGIGRIGRWGGLIGLIRPVPPETRSGRQGAGLLAGLIEPLREAALLQKRLLQLPQQLIQQVVGLVDEAERDVGNDSSRAGFYIGPIGLIGPIGRIGPRGPMGPMLACCVAG